MIDVFNATESNPRTELMEKIALNSTSGPFNIPVQPSYNLYPPLPWGPIIFNPKTQFIYAVSNYCMFNTNTIFYAHNITQLLDEFNRYKEVEYAKRGLEYISQNCIIRTDYLDFFKPTGGSIVNNSISFQSSLGNTD
jgi:hypothetical protein